MIVKSRGKYVVKSHDGQKELGTYDTLEAAHERLRQVEAAKHAKK